ncbi:MAG: hypothetical protein GY898_08295 [Proteobacteria bacterium]|nr:hypothetical protein [Pseudomonadota bacterium]
MQAVDVLFFVLAPLGVERLVLRPEEPGLLKLGLEYMPFSHSLAAALGWGLAAFLVARLAGRPKLGLALGLAVASHWFVDLPMHTEDLPIASGDGLRVGLGMWKSQVGSFAFELAFLVAGFTILAREIGGDVRRRAVLVVWAMAAMQTITVFVAPLPATVLELAIASQAGFFGFAAAAWWIEQPLQSNPHAAGVQRLAKTPRNNK